MQAYIKHFKLDQEDVARLQTIARLATSVSHFDRMLIEQVEWHKATLAGMAKVPAFLMGKKSTPAPNGL